jgi:hypothetical protein
MAGLISGIDNAIAQEKFWTKKKPIEEGFYWIVWRDGGRTIISVNKEHNNPALIMYFLHGSGGYLSQREIEEMVPWWSRESIKPPDLPREMRSKNDNRRNQK